MASEASESDLSRSIGLASPQDVRRVLANLHDPVVLRPRGGETVRRQVIAAIESLRPEPTIDPTARAWRRYWILHWRYVEAVEAPAVQRRLAIGKSQYYREHEAALQALADVLCQPPADTDASPPTVGEPPSGIDLGGHDAVAAPPPSNRLVGLRRTIVLACAAGALVLVAFAAFWVSRSSPPQPPSRTTAGSLPIYAGNGQSGYANGAAATAQFNGLFGLSVDDAGTVYVADTGNHRVRKISTSGLVLDLAGSGVPGYADGPSAAAQFSSPNAVTVTPDGTVYVGDVGNLRIRAISPDGIVSTLAGSGTTGYRDGIGAQAQFTTTGAVVADRSGNVYVPDNATNVVRKITPSGVVTTFAGTRVRGHLDGPADVAQFNGPQRMGGVDGGGNLYVLDTGDYRIRKITQQRVVSTVAGTGVPGYSDGPAAQAQFSADILGVTVDASGTLYVMDAGNRRIRRITPDGMVSTLFEVTDPEQSPGNIKVDRAGNLYLSDRAHNLIYKLPAAAY